MTVEALNCPNCGAGVSSDSTLCQFCKTRLKTMVCPSCFGLIFIGSQFCGHCGAKAVEVVARDLEEPGECPRCRRPLDLLQIGNTSLRECQKCGGLWADVETFQTICSEREKQSTVLGFIGQRELTPEPPAKISYVPCPDCKQLMNRSNFAHASGVIIDTCKQHGVWFDADELPKIIEFIQKGGMEISRQREKYEIEQQRDQLRDERRMIGSLNESIDVSDASGRDGIKHFLGSLFE